MRIGSIKKILDAKLLCGEKELSDSIENIYASDLMSDVLAFGKPNSILLSGLATKQAVISAHMAEFKGVVFIRGKIPADGSEDFAIKHRLVLMSTKYDMYESCVRINIEKNSNTHTNDHTHTGRKIDELILNDHFIIKGNDFAHAGCVSTEVKSTLKKIGFDPKIVRRVAISTYEAEMNVVMHADFANVNFSVTPHLIRITIEDEGKGIPDINLAMKEGFTTATDEMRAMGFGSGMGLPNIKKNSDEMKIDSEVGKGTKLEMIFFT